MKQKFPALFLVLFLALSVVLSGKGTAAGTRLEIRSPTEPVKAGERFEVTVDLTGNPGLGAIQFTLVYDHSQMQCGRADVGSLLEGTFSTANPEPEEGAIVAAASMDEITGDGTVGHFVFLADKDLDIFEFSLEDVIISTLSNEDIPYTVAGLRTVTGQRSATATPTPARRSTAKPTPVRGATATPTPARSSTVTPTPVRSAAATPTPVQGTPSASGGNTETAQAPRFTDTAGHWAEAYINQGAERGLFGGYTDGSFRPGNQLTRAEFMMVLWNLAGRPDSSGKTPFTDIGGRSENIRNAIAWAYGKGYISGTSDTTFSPGLPLTRQAAMKILFSYNGGESGMEKMFTATYDANFTDSSLIAAWAKPAMYWGVYNVIINGTTPATLSPGGTITRAQLAAIMVRYTDRFGTT